MHGTQRTTACLTNKNDFLPKYDIRVARGPLKPGGRYLLLINNRNCLPTASAVFTGDYDLFGRAIMQLGNGDRLHVPLKYLYF